MAHSPHTLSPNAYRGNIVCIFPHLLTHLSVSITKEALCISTTSVAAQSASVSWGCNNEVPQTRWPEHGNVFSSQSRGWKSEAIVSTVLVSPEASQLGLKKATFFLGFHMAFPLCSGPNLFFLQRHGPYWIRAHPLRLSFCLS